MDKQIIPKRPNKSLFSFKTEDSDLIKKDVLQKFIHKKSTMQEDLKKEVVSSFTPLFNRFENRNIDKMEKKEDIPHNTMKTIQNITSRLILPFLRNFQHKPPDQEKEEIKEKEEETPIYFKDKSEHKLRRGRTTFLDVAKSKLPPYKKRSVSPPEMQSPQPPSPLKNTKNPNQFKTRKSSLLVFENFTGRKVSEQVYYTGTNQKSQSKEQNKTKFKAVGKIEKIQRFVCTVYIFKGKVIKKISNAFQIKK